MNPRSRRRALITGIATIALCGGPLAAAVLPAHAADRSAASAASIATLASANAGKGACSTNSLGGHGYESSCTGNGGLPEYWCADFDKWVWASSGAADTSWLDAASGSFYTYGQNWGTLSGWPAVGDVAVFDDNGEGYADHTAIVTQVNPNGTIETASGDWGGESGTEAQFASTSHVVINTPAYPDFVGDTPTVMGMTISGFVAPVGVAVTQVLGATALPVGTALQSGSSLTSPDKFFTLTMQTTGNLVETEKGRTIWSTGTTGHTGAEALVESDGSFIVRGSDGSTLWSAGSGGHNPAAYTLGVQDNGVLVVNGTSWTNGAVPNVVATETILAPYQELISANGLYVLIMQGDGNLVVYTAGRPTWASGTQGNPGAWMDMQGDGNLVIYSAKGTALWASNTHHTTAAAYSLSLAANGELSVTGPSGPVWVSATNVLPSGSALYAGHSLLSPNGLYTLTMGSTGDLYETAPGVVLWGTGTAGHSGATAVLLTNGNLVLYGPGGVVLWQSKVAGRIAKYNLDLQNDSNLVIYGPSGAIWANHA